MMMMMMMSYAGFERIAFIRRNYLKYKIIEMESNTNEEYLVIELIHKNQKKLQ